ncbi:MAG: hypothetical protein KDA81_12180 [Planctomycetaceae bacterium]|nr:hypothetical protein [Planctomycetaceae bacterium]
MIRILSLAILLVLSSQAVHAELRAGAAVVDVTPSQFPVLVNGGMTSRTASEVTTRINARCVVVDDGEERIGIVVVDSCMMPRPLLDEAKHLASMQTKIRPDHILISATHTHTAPSCMGALGTDADPEYPAVLRAGIVEALVKAEANLEPAQVGWGVENAADFTALRRWIRRPDRLAEDPFGNLTVRANMHAGRNWDDVTGESGPEDPDLSVISFQAADGRPIAVLANFSMHYFSGQKALAADYFGLFCDGLQKKLDHGSKNHPPVVGLMSHGCSGDIWRRDYTKPSTEQEPQKSIEEYSDGLLAIALKAYQNIQYRSDADIEMAEARPTLRYRVPDLQRLEWAQKIVAEMGDRPPKTQPEVYAREQIILHERQSTEIVVQALRIGDIAIATTPNETYALSGLKLKLQSPVRQTMVIELANGGDGYIPPPEQHLLGGYNTWAARSAGLEVQAEPKIVETALHLLETVAGQPRREFRQSSGPAAEALKSAKPLAWYRLDEMAGQWAADSSGHQHHAILTPGVAYFLAGPDSSRFCAEGETNRAVHFAGGCLKLPTLPLTGDYTISLWVWNGLPLDARETAGWLVSRGHEFGSAADGLHLGLCGSGPAPGTLVLQTPQKTVNGQDVIERWTWNHVALVKAGTQITAFLNGVPQATIEQTGTANGRLATFIGSRCDGDSSWEGRLDEVAIFDRALDANEIRELSR